MKFLINIMYYFCLYKLRGCWESCKWHRCEKNVNLLIILITLTPLK